MKKNEKVLVVARDVLFKKGHWQGLRRDNLDYYLDLIKDNFEFKPRTEVENDPAWQQIIPYILFNFQDEYFLYRYLQKASEDRLKKDYHLGVAGHINPEDLALKGDVLETAAIREWHEEIKYEGNLSEKKLVGVLNDERRMVEAVHFGLIYLFKGDSPLISVKEKDILKGELVKLKDLGNFVGNASTWAQIVYKEYLSKFL